MQTKQHKPGTRRRAQGVREFGRSNRDVECFAFKILLLAIAAIAALISSVATYA